jgi:hypothetical protein
MADMAIRPSAIIKPLRSLQPGNDNTDSGLRQGRQK